MKANAETPDSSSSADTLKWIIAFALLAAAVVGNYLYGELSVVLRAAGVVVLTAAALGVAATTNKGKAAITFARESRVEVRKVVWPTRQETTQTTLIVVVMVILVALVLWMIDSGLSYIVSITIG